MCDANWQAWNRGPVKLELDGRVVMVTGGSSGLGRALCHSLVGEGAKVAFCGRDEDRLEIVSEELRALGGDVQAVRADVSRPEDLEVFVDQTIARWGRLDGVVNNAGRGAALPLKDSTDSDWDQDLQLKVYAAVRLCRLALPHLSRDGGGAVVNTLNTSAKAPGAASSPSSVSRAAGLALTKTLSREFGPLNVRVNAVCNGTLESPQWERDAAAAGLPVSELYEQLVARNNIPLGRVGLAREYADVVTFLLSPRASFVNGVAVNIDGGQSAVT
jgi:NAD(P)-dependent dehydrogenase (short-subunit alcohol dehydrogenase family)